jgi:amidase
VKEDKPPKMAELAAVRQKFNGADGREHIRRMLKLYGTTQASPGLNVGGDVVPSSTFTELSEQMDAIRSEQLAWFESYDLIVCPASQRAPIRHDFEQPQEVRSRSSYTSQYNTTGWPAGVVRAGTSKDAPGLPLGIQLVAQPWRDDVVIAAMALVEKQTGGWQPPALVSQEKPS